MGLVLVLMLRLRQGSLYSPKVLLRYYCVVGCIARQGCGCRLWRRKRKVVERSAYLVGEFRLHLLWEDAETWFDTGTDTVAEKSWWGRLAVVVLMAAVAHVDVDFLLLLLLCLVAFFCCYCVYRASVDDALSCCCWFCPLVFFDRAIATIAAAMKSDDVAEAGSTGAVPWALVRTQQQCVHSASAVVFLLVQVLPTRGLMIIALWSFRLQGYHSVTKGSPRSPPFSQTPCCCFCCSPSGLLSPVTDVSSRESLSGVDQCSYQMELPMKLPTDFR